MPRKKKKKKSSVGLFQRKVSRSPRVAANKRRQREAEAKLKKLKREAAQLRKAAARKLRK